MTSALPLKLTKTMPVMERMKPVMKNRLMCFSFKKIWAIMAVNIGQIETMMLTLLAEV